MTNFSPPSSSGAALGNKLMTESFGTGTTSTFSLFVEDFFSLDALFNFSIALNSTLVSMPPVQDCGSPCLLTFQGYWTLRSLGLPNQAYDKFLKGTSTFFELEANIPFSINPAMDWAKQVEIVVEKERQTYLPQSTITLLGIPRLCIICLSISLF